MVNILEDARDLAVISKAEQEGRFVYAAKPSLERLARFYEASISNPEDAQVPAFQHHYEFDRKKGITGASSLLDLRLDKTLRPHQLWLPGLLEGKVLDKNKKLGNGVYRGYGIILLDNSPPDEEIAEALVAQASRLGLQLPLIVPFRALDYSLSRGNEKYGLDISFVESPRGIISGEEAVEQIKLLDLINRSGVRRLIRGFGGDWDANWGRLADSNEYGRSGDWICGEATRGDLLQAYKELMKRKYLSQIKKLESAQKRDVEEFEQSLSPN